MVIGPGRLSRYSESLRAGRSGDRIPLEAKYSAPVQTGPGAHQPHVRVLGSFPRVKRPVRAADHPPSLTTVKVTKYSYTPTSLHPPRPVGVFMACYRENFTLFILCKGKANPLQAWTGPEASKRLWPPDFKTIGA